MPCEPSRSMTSHPKVRLKVTDITNPTTMPTGAAAVPTTGISAAPAETPESAIETPACRASMRRAGTMSNISFILSLLYLLFLAADGQHLRGVGGNNLVLGVGSDDLDGDVFEPGKEDSLPHVGLQQKELFLIRQVEGLLQSINGGRRLFEQQLDGGVGNHGESVRRLEEVVHVLGNGRQPQVVLAAAFGHTVEEGRRVVGLHHPPRLVDDQQALFEVLAHRVPDVVGYQVHRHRLEVVLHVAYGKDDELFVDVDIGRLVDKARPRALSVLAEALDQELRALHAGEHQLKVGQEWRLYLGKVGVHRYVFERVGFGNGLVDDGVLRGGQPPEHNAEHPHQRHDVGAQDVGRRLVLARRREVKRVDMVLGVERDVEVPPAHRLREELVLALRVDDDDVGVKHQRAQNFELSGIAFAGARLGKDDRVVVLQRKAVKEHQ